MDKRTFWTLLIALAMIISSACAGASATPAGSNSGATPYPVESTTAAPAAPTPTPTPAPAPLASKDLVVLLIVDDFGAAQIYTTGQQTTEQATETNPPKDGNCLIYPDGQGQFGARGMAGVGFKGVHGDFVYSEAQNTLRTKGASQVASRATGDSFSLSDSWLRNVEVWNITNGDIDQQVVLAGVDTEGFTTQRVIENIDHAINAFSSPTQLGSVSIPAAHLYVINMSFAIIPCDPNLVSDPDTALKNYEEILNDPELKDLANQLQSLVENNVITKEEAGAYARPDMHVIYNPATQNPNDYRSSFLEGDPLLSKIDVYVKESQGGEAGRTVIPVASAGNFSEYPFPFAPAMLDSVVSVSAQYKGTLPPDCNIDLTKMGSNPGEVEMEGVHSSDCAAGTSFAAPKLSVLEALYLLKGLPVNCPTAPGVIPPLGYAQGAPTWDNLSLTDARSQFCAEVPDFP